MNISDWNCSAFECKSTLHTDYWNNSFFGSVCCISGLSFFWFFVDIRWFNFHWNIVVKQYSTLLSPDCDGINVWLAMWLVLLKCYQMCCINWLSCSNPISFYIEVIHPKVCENCLVWQYGFKSKNIIRSRWFPCLFSLSSFNLTNNVVRYARTKFVKDINNLSTSYQIMKSLSQYQLLLLIFLASWYSRSYILSEWIH